MRIEKVPTLLIDVLFATNKIFGDGIDAEQWKSFEYEAGMIRFRGKFCYGPAGIEGTLGIGIPPRAREAREHDDDAWWENALEWDWWSCLGLLTIPSSEYDQQIVVFFMGNTFFDRPLEIIKTITPNHNHSNESDRSMFGHDLATCFGAFSDEFDEDNSNTFKQLLELEFDAKFINFEYVN